jgi:enamidase
MGRIRVLIYLGTSAVLFLAGVTALTAQQPTNPSPLRQFLKFDAPVVALTHVRVIDGTGATARDDQTVVIRDGSIAAVGPAATTAVPPGATTVDGTGKSVMPGLVMLHEHLYYPTGPGVYGQLGASFVRLYLAGGVTTMRTAGNENGFMDFALARGVEAGEIAGPSIDATAPYLNGPRPASLQMNELKGPDDARRQVADLLRSFGWRDVVDLGDLTAARGMEAYLLLWLRLYGAAGSPLVNTKIVR